jgi:protein O-GlcNAc transferase
MTNDINRALALHQAGRLNEAEALYRQILQTDPEQPDALHLLGIIALQSGHNDKAVGYLGKAVKYHPQVPDYHYNLGLALAGLGKPVEAAHHFRQATALKPDFAEAHNNLGNALKEQGQLDQALESYQRALVLNPHYAAAHSNLGVTLQDRGDTQGAMEHYQKAVAIDAADPDSQYNLANALRAMGRLDEAVNGYRKAIALRADFLDAYINLGMALKDSDALDSAIEVYEHALALDPKSTTVWIRLGNVLKGQGKIRDAIDRYKRAIDIDPACAEAHYNLGNALREVGEHVQAIAALKQATKLKPNFREAYTNLGDLLWEMGRLDDALVALRGALALSPDSAEAHNNLGNVLKAQGKLGEAIAAYREASAKREFPPAHNNLGFALQDQGDLDAALATYRQALTLDTHFADAHSNLLLCLHYRPDVDATELFAEHQRWGEQHGAPLAAMIPTHTNARDPKRRLRIGYVSPDFRAHSVSHFIAPVLTHHERRHFQVYCYYNARQIDATTERLRGLADHWRDIAHLSDAEVTALIGQDGIDILVDLAGHMAHNRLPLFARKPAPLQVTYLGYPDTTGLATIDYRLTDALTDPPGASERFHTEALVRLPQGFLTYQPSLESPPINALPALGDDHITFGSFNNATKLNTAVIALWAQILRALPRAHLLLKAAQLGDADTAERFRQRFVSEGIAPERVQTLGAFASEGDHLKVYHRIDIALDPFPYNGTTTTCEALWMGVPVITLAGTTHAGRVGVSLLTQAGLPELITPTPQAYVELAIELANDLPRLQGLRQSLRERLAASALCDAKGFTRALEAAYREMWVKYCGSS